VIDFAQYIVDALSLGSLYALAALGIGLTFGILRLVNIAYGEFITVGVYALIVPSMDVTARMFVGGWSWPLAVVAVALIVVAVALIADALVFRRFRRASVPTMMIASFAVSYIIQNAIFMVYGARPKALSLWEGLARQIMLGPLRLSLRQLVVIGTTFALLAILALFLRRTSLGVQMRAAAEDFRMARYLGVKANFVIGAAFALSAILAAVVALLYVSQSGVLAPTMGVPLVLFGLVAMVIGGMGSLIGAVAGGFLIGFVMTMLSAYLPDNLRMFRDTFAFALVIVILLLRPAGLIPTKSQAERI
jgi:branched-chain amino acid transport system permease protein